MANVLDDLRIHLEGQSLGIPNDSIRKGFLPTSVNPVIALTEVIGSPPVDTLGQVKGRINIERPRVQVITRGSQGDYKEARDLAELAYKALHGVTETIINGTRYLTIEAESPPNNIGRDENDRWMLEFTCDIWKEPNA